MLYICGMVTKRKTNNVHNEQHAEHINMMSDIAYKCCPKCPLLSIFIVSVASVVHLEHWQDLIYSVVKAMTKTANNLTCFSTTKDNWLKQNVLWTGRPHFLSPKKTSLLDLACNSPTSYRLLSTVFSDLWYFNFIHHHSLHLSKSLLWQQ